MTETLEVDALVIGGGVVGLAVARALSLAGRQVTLLEAEARLGHHTSSRNSEVIHAGIYYPPGSLKARACLAGKRLLYAYCAEKGIAHRRLGKLLVASEESEIASLQAIWEKAQATGGSDLEWVEARHLADLEPELRAVRGLLSPSTGIVDSHGLMSALRRDAEDAGAQMIVKSPVLDGQVSSGGFELRVGGTEASRVRCRSLVNAAGLTAPSVAWSVRGVPAASIPGQYFAKGHYFTLNGRSPFSHLVYPVPVPGGLGIHVTLDLSGQARFGPDVSWVDRIDYSFDESRANDFYTAIRRYFPALADGALSPGYTGIRPKLSPAGSPADDFLLQGPAEHGVPGLLNLYGIESPGLTSCLALAQLALQKLGISASEDP